MTAAERDRLKEFLWLILPAGSRSPSRLDWIVDGIEQGRFPTSRDAHKGGADAAQAACEHEGHEQ